MTTRPTTIDFLKCLGSVLQDWLDIHPEDHEEVKRDLQRIAFEYERRGLPFFTIDLPAIGKILDRSMDDGRLVRSTAPHMRRRWKGKPIPRLFSGLWLRLFTLDGLLREDADPTALAFLRTLCLLYKKVRLDCSPKNVRKAVDEYYEIESKLPPAPQWWEDGAKPDPHKLGSLEDCLRRSHWDNQGLEFVPPYYEGQEQEPRHIYAAVQLIADRLVVNLPFIEDSDLRPKHGPGAVSEKPEGGYKFNFPSWSPRLEAVLPFLEFGTHSPDSILEGSLPVLFPKLEETASKLIAVPKTQKGPRLIASEPICNQWMQQAVAIQLRKDVMAHPVLKHSIDFFDQEPSRVAALEASRDGSRATIDLSSASDRLTCWLVQRVFRRNVRLLELLAATRTVYLRNPTFVHAPKLVKLKKFASMGSALTFPVQSIVFAILAIGYGSAVTGRDVGDCAKQVRVFGDDMIVPKAWVAGFSELLENLYLKVNRDKTYGTGLFRESCGMDAWNGYDVTPAYIRYTTVAHNNRSSLGLLYVINNSWIKGYWRLAKKL
jgi:hypothetical protein